MATNPNPSPIPTPDPNSPGKKNKKKSKPGAFADVVREWESLLAAVADQAPNRASIEPHRAALAETLDKAKAVKGTQESHRVSRQSMTQSLQELLVEGKDRMIRLRGAIKAELGPTTEQLNQFGIRPLRRRPLRHKKDSTPATPPAPEVQGHKGVE
jgi:hypothetical protein